MSTDLPGAQGNKLNPPPLIGWNVTPEQRAAIEKNWADMAATKQSLAEIMEILNRHQKEVGIWLSSVGRLP